MTKTLRFFFLIFIIFPIVTPAQVLSRHALVSSGASTVVNNLQFSWSIGQGGLAGSLTEGGIIFNAGFQQGDTVVITSLSDRDHMTLLKVFPNPFQERFTIAVDPDLQSEISFQVFDRAGRTIWEEIPLRKTGSHGKEIIDLASQPPGLYTMIVTFSKASGKIEKFVIKLIKL